MCCPRSRVNKRIFKIFLLSGSLLFSIVVVFIGCENKQTRGRRAYKNTTLLQEGGGFCVDGCSVCLLTPAGAEPGAEGVAAGAGRRAAHRLARLRGHEEGRRSLRWAGLHAHSHMHSHTQVLLKSINSFTGLCLSLKQRESILRLQRGSKIKHC